MFIFVLILLVKVFGDCVNPTVEECASKSIKNSCNEEGTGCRYVDAFSGACGPQTADSCGGKEQSGCVDGCSWSSDAGCVRVSPPVCSETDYGCSPGCVVGPQRVRCLSGVERCARYPVGSCVDQLDCKVEGSKCVPKTESDLEKERCLEKGVGDSGDACQLKPRCEGTTNCDQNGCVCDGATVISVDTCKIVGGSCVPRTYEEYQQAWCNYQAANGTGGCTGGDGQCKLQGTNCVMKTFVEFYDPLCGNTFTVDNCESGSGGTCKVIGNTCKANPEFNVGGGDNDDIPICSLNSEGSSCDDNSDHDCTTVYDYPCVPNVCSADGAACSSSSVAAGCEWRSEGHCEVNPALNCVEAFECTSERVGLGCVSTPAVTGACIPKAELVCSGSDSCGSNALAAGCKNVGDEKPGGKPDDSSSASTIVVPMMVFMLLALFF